MFSEDMKMSFLDVFRRYEKIEVSNVDWKHLVTESEYT